MANSEAKNLLEVEESSFADKLVIQPNKSEEDSSTQPVSIKITPKPGFCLKTKDHMNRKIFINICQAENLPTPKSITDEELLKFLQEEDPSGFRIPMSLGEPHKERDTKGGICSVYDVVVNPEFLVETEKRNVLLGFFLTAVLEGLEQKYDITLDRDWRLLKNRKFFGSLPDHNIRTKSKPWILEMDSQETPPEQPKRDPSRIPEPTYRLIKDPSDGHPDFLVMDIQLPKLSNSRGLTVDLTDDWIRLETRAEVYRINKGFPYDIIPEETGATFDRKRRVLTLTIPVVPEEEEEGES